MRLRVLTHCPGVLIPRVLGRPCPVVPVPNIRRMCNRAQLCADDRKRIRPKPLPWFGPETAIPETRAFPSIPTQILLPIDFRPSSKSALDMSADLAVQFHAKLFILKVIPFL